MLRTTVDLAKYKFIYTYDKFTIYSNIASDTLALETMPMYTNDYNDQVLKDLLTNELAPIIILSPIVIPFRIVVFTPIKTLLPISIGAQL